LDGKATPATPTSVGGYQILRLLAKTDLSEVYAARSESGQTVCLKRLSPELALKAREIALSFRREAALLSEVAHPNVVRVLAVGEEEGIPFTCLELVEGRTLREEIAAGPVPAGRAVVLLRQVATALTRVHERGIIHADLKPANVLVRETPSGPEVKLADFGLALEAAQRGGVQGTPHYMAPEQTGLVDWPVDARTDLYALGALGYELLAGRPPFDADDPAALLLMQVQAPPPRLLEARPDAPPALEKVLLKLLAKSPAARYRSARGVERDLEQLQERLAAGDRAADFVLDGASDAGLQVGQVFVGRARELAELEAALERARGGTPGAMLVGGAAGVGKSALLRELQNRSLASGAHFAAGKCYAFARALPYHALAEALADHLARLRRRPRAEVEARLEEVRRAVGDLGGELVKVAPAYAGVFPGAPPPVYLGEGKDQARFLQVLVRFLEAAAPPGSPLVLLLDDLQWADSATLRALEAVLDGGRRCAVLLLLTYRSEEVGADHPARRLLDRAGRSPGVLAVDIRPFDRADTALLLAESLRQPLAALPPALVELVQERTQGNPLFVTEVLRALLAAGALAVRSGALRMDAQAMEAARLPGSVVEVVLRRLGTLPPVTRRVLGTAALAGKAFDLPLAARAAGVAVDEAFQAVQDGLAEKLLQAARGGLYRFQHDRVQEACAHLVPEAERPGIHLRVVEYLEAVDPELAGGDRVFDGAEHAFLGGDAGRVWRYSRAAGERAQARYANEQALVYLRRAIDAAAAAGAPAAEVRAARSRLTETLDLLGRYAESVAESTRVLEGGEALGPEERARALTRIAYSLLKSGQAKEARDRLLEALAALGEPLRLSTGRRARALSRARYARAALSARLGRRRRADSRGALRVEILYRLWSASIADAALLPPLAYRMIAGALPLGPSRELAIAHRVLTVTLVQLPRPRWERALEHGRRSVEIARAIQAPLEAAIGSLYTADVYCWSARFREALPWLQTAREGLSALGNMWELANAHIFSFIAYRATGRLDEALAHAQSILEIGERLGVPNTISNGCQKMADILLLRGEQAKGDTYLGRSLALAEERNLGFERFQAHKILGATRLREGRYEDARRHYGAAVDVLEQNRFLQAYLGDAYFGRAEAFLRDTDHLAASGGLSGEAGRAVVADVRAWLEREEHLRANLGYGLRVAALIAWRAGDARGGRRLLQRGLQVLERQDRPLDLAFARLDGAELLAGTDRAQAVEWAAAARAFFEDQRLRPSLERADRLLEQLGHAAPRPAAAVAAAEKDRSTRALEELIRVGKLLMEVRAPDELLERIVGAAVSLLGAERGFIFSRAEEGAPLSLLVGRTADGQRVPEEEANVSRGVLERVERSGQGVAVSDTRSEETLRDRRSIMAYQLRSVLCAPLDHGGRRLGVLYLDSQITAAIFGPAELELLTSFAGQAASALTSAQHVARIEEMNRALDAKVLERTRQLESMNLQLSESMDQLRNTTLRLAEAKREALEKELQLARSIQLSMVPPAEVIDAGAARIRGMLEPASFCGGDFWTYVRSGERVLLLIGDVTGHGVASAMIAGTAKSCLDTLSLGGAGAGVGWPPLDRLMETMNDVVHRAAGGRLVMTAFAVEVDPERRALGYCAAGHNPQLLVRPGGGKPVSLFEPSPRLGDEPGSRFVVKTAPYAPGDRLVLYTDGVVERAGPKKDEEYGSRRFKALLQREAAKDAPGLLEAIRADLAAFAQETPSQDDVTVVVAELR